MQNCKGYTIPSSINKALKRQKTNFLTEFAYIHVVCLKSVLTLLYVYCFQAIAVLTSKHFAQRQPWWHCAAATPRYTAAASNWSWMSHPSSWGPATSARPWGQSSQPPRGLWLLQAEPCPPPLGPCWPALSPWCWKLCSESSPMLNLLTWTTHTVGTKGLLVSAVLFSLYIWWLLLLPPWLLLSSPLPTVLYFLSLCSILLFCVLVFVSPWHTTFVFKHSPWICRGDNTGIR